MFDNFINLLIRKILGFILAVWAIIYDNIALTKVIAEITKTKSDRARTACLFLGQADFFLVLPRKNKNISFSKCPVMICLPSFDKDLQGCVNHQEQMMDSCDVVEVHRVRRSE